ncbi:helix-turn-helix domain-containing protein [Candidatus Vondammii sp. HM_W22]|uniref:helix-turn-helix domain-containing protein n=1 Tax=Candidatus Vondammii sp. HM_W22 TaxID=2687299 RepID=UPI00403D9E03
MPRLFGGYCPSVRKRSQNALSLEEHEEISRGLSVGLSLRQIARDLDRSPSTISREIQHNGGMNRYRANIADSKAWDRARRLKQCRLSQ